jgi:hypothetical protein
VATETVVVECTCGEETALTPSETACEECETEHTGDSSGRICPTDSHRATSTSTPGAIETTKKTTMERYRTEEALCSIT